VVLDRFELKFCCLPHSNNTKGFVRACDFDGGPLPMDEILAARKELTRLNNTDGVDSACKGCHFLRKMEWEQPTGPAWIRQLEISSFALCNLKCIYCFTVLEPAESLPKQGYPLRPIFDDMIEKGYFFDDAVIGWGGGEPTIIKDFDYVANLLLESGLQQRIFTNAVRHSEIIHRGLEQGKITITVSIDAGTRETYNKIKGVDRFDRVWKNMALYSATGGEVTAKYIVRDGNKDPGNVVGFVNCCAERNIKKVAATPDLHEIAHHGVSDDVAYAFARLDQETSRHGIELMITDEYLNQSHMRDVKRFMPLRTNGWRYMLIKAKRGMRKNAGTMQRMGQRVLKSGATRTAIRQADSFLSSEHCDPQTLADLFEHQTKYPHPELNSKLSRLVKAQAIPGKLVQGAVTAIGLSTDCWTTGGRPCYIVVDGESSTEDTELAIWAACFADGEDLPITMTISDGSGEEIVHTYRKPEQVRLELPKVTAGTTRIFSVMTDKSWSPKAEDDRMLGVHLGYGPI